MCLAAAGTTGCGDRGPLPLKPSGDGAAATEPDRLASLLELERELRASTDFAALPPFERRSGSNPHRIILVGGDRFAGVTRGGDELVVLDRSGAVIASAPTPRSPVDLARRGDQLWVAAEGSGALARYRLGDQLESLEPAPIEGARALRAIAVAGDGAVYVADDFSGAISRRAPGGQVSEIARCHGATQLAIAGDRLLVNCMLDHQLAVWTTGATPEKIAAIEHDGPMWRFATAKDGDDLLVAIAGIEDRPLDRSVKGSFGFIDSFIFVYRLSPGREPARLAAVNVGAHGLITPKWLDIALDGDGARIRASSYGGDRFIAVRYSDRWGEPEVSDLGAIAPGTTDVAWLGDELALAANPLLDAWMLRRDGAWTSIAQAPGDPRSPESRVGELLFFTRLMAPFGTTEGRKSRFTCEACHFEGYVDGRTHYTGRGDVSATSRSLRGLFNNRPHFSRALDKTTAKMIDNEFRVANKLSGHDYWFTLQTAEFPWLSHLELPGELGPVFLRRSLMAFLRDFTNRPNPAVRGREGYSDIERRGAELFRDRCASCHSPRLIVDDPGSEVPFAKWERLIFSEAGPITWASSDYTRTGITPYVHELGTRAASLRRLYKKWPYFTNGSAASITEVIEQMRFKGDTVVHRGLESGERFDAAEVAALESFLGLL